MTLSPTIELELHAELGMVPAVPPEPSSVETSTTQSSLDGETYGCAAILTSSMEQPIGRVRDLGDVHVVLAAVETRQ